jgi:hypothetical protein
MDHLRIFNAVREDFGDTIALSVCQIIAISLTTKVKKSDFIANSFTDRVTKKAMKLLWELSDADFYLAVNLWKLSDSWETRQDMYGLGGCVKMTFKELYDEKHSLQPTDSLL